MENKDIILMPASYRILFKDLKYIKDLYFPIIRMRYRINRGILYREKARYCPKQ